MSSLSNLRRPRRTTRLSPVTLLGTSALVPHPTRADDPRAHLPLFRIT